MTFLSFAELLWNNYTLQLYVYLSPNDYYYYKDDFINYIKMLFFKNYDVLNVLWRYELFLSFDRPEECIIKSEEKVNMPQEYLDILFQTSKFNSTVLNKPEQSEQAIETETQTAFDMTYIVSSNIKVSMGKTLEEMMEWEF